MAVVIVDGHGEFLTPCGRCRQLLFEHGSGETLLAAAPEPRRLGDLLPEAFPASAIAAQAGVTASNSDREDGG